MRSRFTSALVLVGVLSAGCGALLGEDFHDYRTTTCAPESGLPCAGGTWEALGGSDAAGSSAAGAYGLGGAVDVAGAASVGGRGGTGGHAGMDGETGTAGSVGTTGSAGTAGNAGTNGNTSPDCQPDATIIPECALYSDFGNYPAVALPAANGIAAMSYEAFSGGFNVVASKRATSTVAQIYTKTSGDTVWTSWFCFDAIPQPDRFAVAPLLNGLAEVFATTRCGGLYRRTQTVNEWLPWQPFSVPAAGSAVTDAATSVAPDGTNFVYVADGGGVFTRHRTGSDSYAPYGAWQEISGASGASLVTAGLRFDLRQQVFSLDGQGSVRTSIQRTNDPDSAFGPWSDFDSSQLPAPLVDIEAPHGGPPPLEVFAVDSNGNLWLRAEGPAGGFGPWTPWRGPPPPATLVSLSGAALKAASGTPLQLVGLGAAGGVYTLRRTAAVWDDWRQLQ
jgi:hypothetical protein